jgi:hypothetical protein
METGKVPEWLYEIKEPFIHHLPSFVLGSAVLISIVVFLGEIPLVLEVTLEFITLIVGIFVLIAIEAIREGGRFHLGYYISRRVRSLPAHKAFNALFYYSIEKLTDKIKELESEEGTELDDTYARKFFESLFEDGKYYCGVDTHVPSVFFERQQEYLAAHKKLQERIKKSKTRISKRILIVDDDDLKDNWYRHKDEFQKFLDWHKNNNVKLRIITPPKAEACKAKYKLRSTEVGVRYDKYSLQFNLDGNEKKSAEK